MKPGVVFPQTEIGSDPIAIKDFAQAVEDLGYDFLLAYDHVVGANPDRPGGWSGRYTYRDAFHEPFVLFGYLAGLTTRLTFVTGILVLPQRYAVLVAKQAAQVDLLSGGRLELGVGIGWNAVEFQAMDSDFHTRGRRIEEQIAVMRELWTKPLVTFRGRDHTLDDVGINPMPVQRPIPIWIGGMADVVLRRTARLADGWIPNTRSPDDSRESIAQLRRYLENEGRNPDGFGVNARIRYAQIPEDQWPAHIAGWRELGVTHLCINTMDAGLKTPDEHLAVIRRFRDVVK